MATRVIMPALGMAQDTGRIVAWLKAAGDRVAAGEAILAIETDKVTVEIEAAASGILSAIAAQDGDDVPVGATIAWIAQPGEALPEEAARRDAGRPALTPVAARMAAAHDLDPRLIPSAGARVHKADVLSYLQTRAEQPVPARIAASPKARRIARERGIELATLRGTGPGGAVLAADVPPALPVVSPALSPLWRTMAERVTASWREVPHFYLVRDADAGALAGWYRSLDGRTPKVTYTDLLVKLAALALAKHPRMNASWRDQALTLHERIGIGIAVAVADGLLVPVIRDADRLPLREIAAQRLDLTTRAAAGALGLDDLQGGTFTISNLGMYGVDQFSAIINPPQCAILAVGRIAERVVPVNGVPGVRPMLTLTLASDHRAVDGARAAAFLATLAGLIEDPLRGVYD